MKQYIYLVAFFISAFGFAQNTGTIQGNLQDLEANNAPLIFGKISIKETGAEVLSDENGHFAINDIKAGEYTLVYSFVGYETKETKIQVTNNKSTYVTLQLAASTISLDDLVSALASNNSKSNTVNN
ncbi:carboxypeptidase-like regulatory domain-containing protein [Tamlana fucoidanivorans]|uniref:Carboxypeptidase-like regulatory domain-containing protein n=1 Tax=Allotamlana fucoidanivorans TaxID=2583814 RepID=A0A5C4SMU8_9FLAO|nr:carboxypeptidase-like regulatory domain-containing protein [Tamlana fucoidanivorans]TNJ45315.1 carboxypeptidase-like regulatory domain-containing protein [Tamlana fucoidanivorans]